MGNNTIHQRYPTIEDVGMLIDMIDLLFGIQLIVHTYGKKIASKYWSGVHVCGNMLPCDVLKSILNNMVMSDWFEAFEIEENETEIRITLKQVFGMRSKTGRLDFLTGFIEEMVKKAYGENDQIKVLNGGGSNTYNFIFTNMKQKGM